MCVCLAPARLSNTVLYVGEAVRDGKLVHVLGYQNKAQNLAMNAQPPSGGMDAKTWDQLTGSQGPIGNAMILPFPASALMGPENVVDTSSCKHVLKDIAEAVRLKSKGMRSASLGSDAMYAKSVQVFESGIYTVVLARDPRDIPAALARVPTEKRPALKPEIFEAYAKWYPGWQIALCCFSNREAIDADPMLWWYEPAAPSHYFVPTLDSHTGGVPDLEATVRLDHVIAVGAPKNKGSLVIYSEDDIRDEVRVLLPDYANGAVFNGFGGDVPNGDFLLFKADAIDGRFRPQRLKPGRNPAISL